MDVVYPASSAWTVKWTENCLNVWAQGHVQPEDSHYWWPRGCYWGQNCLTSMLVNLVDCAAVSAHLQMVWNWEEWLMPSRVVLPSRGAWNMASRGWRNMTGSSWCPAKGYGKCWPWAGAAPCTVTGWGWPQKGPWGPGGPQDDHKASTALVAEVNTHIWELCQ